MLSLSEIVGQFTASLKQVDAREPEEDDKPYDSGIGPFRESSAIEREANELGSTGGWENAETERRYPFDGRMHCDLYFPGDWAIEVKLLRPFGDNDWEMEHWSEDALHPYTIE